MPDIFGRLEYPEAAEELDEPLQVTEPLPLLPLLEAGQMQPLLFTHSL